VLGNEKGDEGETNSGIGVDVGEQSMAMVTVKAGGNECAITRTTTVVAVQNEALQQVGHSII
jgi:hypothetical protein